MKRAILIRTFVFIMVLGTIGSWDANGKSGPAIPLPVISLSRAVEMTKKFLVEEYENDGDKEFEAFKKECIVTSVEYTKGFVQESGESRKVTDLGESVLGCGVHPSTTK